MQTETEHSSGKMPHSKQPEELWRELVNWAIGQLAVVAVAQRETVTEQCFRVMAEDLCSDLSREQLQIAFTRARRELKFFPKIAELRDLAGANPKHAEQAEGMAAWDAAVEFANRYVQSDVHGGYEVSQGCRSTPPPELSGNILSCVRLCGGWRTFKTMTQDDYPFVQKRFLENYAQAEYFAAVPLSHLLTAGEDKQLTGQSIRQLPAAMIGDTGPVTKKLSMPFPDPLTVQELRGRREMLRQQTDAVLRRRTARDRIEDTPSQQPEVDTRSVQTPGQVSA